MQAVDDLPLEAGPLIYLVNWNNALQRENDSDEQVRQRNNELDQLIRQQLNERANLEGPPQPPSLQHPLPRPLNKVPADVQVRNGVKYFYVWKHNLWFSYISDQMIGEQIDEPAETPMLSIYNPSTDPPLDLVLVNKKLYYVSKDRKFYKYNDNIHEHCKEIPEPFWRYLMPRCKNEGYPPAEINSLEDMPYWSEAPRGCMIPRRVHKDGEEFILDLYPGYLLCTFDDYKEEVVWNPQEYTFNDRLPINITEFKGDKLHLTSLPPLPASLKILRCHRNQLTELPELPSNLVILSCGRNQLTALPVLPAGLKELSIAYNQISNLTSLPSGLRTFICDSNPLKSLPSLPTGLYTLSCKNTQITCIPTLPETLGFLNCSHNHLGELPTLPEGLDTLWCHNCRLTKLPEIPESLTRLDYSHNRIRGIVDFPYWVQYYKCSYNFIEGFDLLRYDTGCSCCDSAMKDIHLNNLVKPAHKHHPFNFKSPRELLKLDCSHNRIKTLPEFPDELRKLNCSHTRIVSLPDLPANLQHLDCSYTPLRKLPAIPQGVSYLDCSSTLINTLPELEVLPFRFGSLSCYNTRLDPGIMRYIDQGDLDSVNYYTFAQRHKEGLKKDVRPVLNLWIALGCGKNSEYMETDHGVLPAEITRRIAMCLTAAANKQPIAGVWSLAAIVAGFRAHVLEPIVRPENIV